MPSSICCLNGMQKITPERLPGWMAILKQVARQRALAAGGTDDTNARLKQLAEQSGVSRATG